MPRRCGLGCTPTRGVLHVFPNPGKFPEQFKAWVRTVSGKDEIDFDYKKMRICDRHFTEKDRNRNNRLNALTVPSLFLPDKSEHNAMQPPSKSSVSSPMSEQTINEPEVYQSPSGFQGKIMRRKRARAEEIIKTFNEILKNMEDSDSDATNISSSTDDSLDSSDFKELFDDSDCSSDANISNRNEQDDEEDDEIGEENDDVGEENGDIEHIGNDNSEVQFEQVYVETDIVNDNECSEVGAEVSVTTVGETTLNNDIIQTNKTIVNKENSKSKDENATKNKKVTKKFILINKKDFDTTGNVPLATKLRKSNHLILDSESLLSDIKNKKLLLTSKPGVQNASNMLKLTMTADNSTNNIMPIKNNTPSKENNFNSNDIPISENGMDSEKTFTFTKKNGNNTQGSGNSTSGSVTNTPNRANFTLGNRNIASDNVSNTNRANYTSNSHSSMPTSTTKTLNRANFTLDHRNTTSHSVPNTVYRKTYSVANRNTTSDSTATVNSRTYTMANKNRSTSDNVANVLKQSISNFLSSSANTSHTVNTTVGSVNNVQNAVHDNNNTQDNGKKAINNNYMSMSMSFEEFKKLTEKEKVLRTQLCKLKKSHARAQLNFKKRLTVLKAAKKLTNDLKKLPDPVRVFLNMQIQNNTKKKKEGSFKGRRFTEKEKMLAISLLKQNPHAYKFMHTIFALPSKSTLRKYSPKIKIQDGINKVIFDELKTKAANMKDHEKVCILLFDEMVLTRDISIGQSTRSIYVSHVEIFMIRGVAHNYKQAVAYYYSQGTTEGPVLAQQIKTVITSLQESGFKVVATVCDQAINNCHALKVLLDESYYVFLLRNEPVNKHVFIVNDDEIVPLYDPPTLIKAIRNNLLTKNLHFQIKNKIHVASWKHLELLMNEDPGYKGSRIVPKFTEYLVVPEKMNKAKVKYASQIFSTSVGTLMGYLAEQNILPIECKDTANLLLFFDTLFDSVNGTYTNIKKITKPTVGPLTPTSSHLKCWDEGITVLKTMSFYNELGQEVVVPTLHNWIWDLEGLQVLYKNLVKHNIKTVTMRHINLDPLENFMYSMKKFNNKNDCNCHKRILTLNQFEFAFAAFVINSMHSPYYLGSNCEDDLAQTLIECIDIAYASTEPVIDTVVNENEQSMEVEDNVATGEMAVDNSEIIEFITQSDIETDVVDDENIILIEENEFSHVAETINETGNSESFDESEIKVQRVTYIYRPQKI